MARLVVEGTKTAVCTLLAVITEYEAADEKFTWKLTCLKDSKTDDQPETSTRKRRATRGPSTTSDAPEQDTGETPTLPGEDCSLKSKHSDSDHDKQDGKLPRSEEA